MFCRNTNKKRLRISGKFISEGYNGVKRNEATLKNGVFHGNLKTYYENGKIHVNMHMKNGKLHGKFKEYYHNGKLKTVSYFIDGNINGTTKTYDMMGNLINVSKIKSGKILKQESRYYY